MIEMTGWILAAWTIGTALLCLASSWGAVRYQQKSFEKRLDDFTRGQKCLEHRMSGIEKSCMTVIDCKDKQKDRDTQRDYRESHLVQKLNEIQVFIKEMDNKREQTKTELRDQLGQIKTELAIVRASIISGSSKAMPVHEINNHDDA